MKKKILICTIMRNQEQNINNWYNQICQLSDLCKDWSFSLSVYENDSVDGTAKKIKELKENWEGAPSPHLKAELFIVGSENLGTKSYGSVWSLDRIRNLANARQKCIDQVGHLEFDKIAFIEPDVEYDPNWCKELILAKHPEQAGIIPHIYSGWSLRSNTHPKESCFLYDTCATRQTDKDVCWNFEKESEWRGKTLIKTHISDIDSNCLHFVWSTFNCFCVYDAAPFQDGVKWRYMNHRLNTGQEEIKTAEDGGWLDADTSVICEWFRAFGYNNIMLNTNCLIRHK